MKKTLIKTLFLFIACTSLAFADKIPVVVSFSILNDLTAQIGGERIQLSALVGPNQDAHIYQTTPSDIKKLQNARLFIVNGLGFEGASFNRAISQSKVKTIVASKGIRPLRLNNNTDPHAWHNPALVQTYVRNIAAALIEIDPKGKDYYNKRLNSYLLELTKLDNWANQSFRTIPVTKRKVLTGHDAFGYLGARYQIQFIAPQSISTESEASAKTVASIIKQVKAQNIQAIFAENIKDRRLIDQISKETKAKLRGTLYSDALTAKNQDGGSYLKMMYFNIRQLTEAMK